MIALFSYGAFIHRAGQPGYEQIDHKKRQSYINKMSALFLMCIPISTIYFVLMRRVMLTKIEELDQDAITPSDYCLMGCHMNFDGDYS